MIVGIDEDTSQLGGAAVSYGLAMVDLSVANQAVSTAAVTLTPNGGTAIPLIYLASASYNGYNFACYASTGSGSVSAPAQISYLGGTSYTLTVANIGDTATCSLTAPGGYAFTYNPSNGGVTAAINSLGSIDAAFAYGVSGTTGSLTYQSTSPSGNPFPFPSSAYSLSSPATYISAYEAVGWTTNVVSTTGVKGGLIGVGLGVAESSH